MVSKQNHSEAFQGSKEFSEKIQTQLKDNDLEVKDVVANKDYRIKMLEDELKRMEKKLKVERDDNIKKLYIELQRIWTQWDEYVRQVSSEMVLKDTEMIALQERETKLRTELERSREQIERYKQQLSAGLTREKVLEKNRVQMELEWQRRFEDVKADHYLANEQLIQDLIQARDQAKAELTEREQELHDLTVLLQSVRRERDQAIQGLTPKVDSLASEEIQALQEQNNVLRAAVTQMRKDMEGVSHLLTCSQTDPRASSPQPVQHPESSAHTRTATGPPGHSTGNPADCPQPVEQEVSLSRKHLKEQLAGAPGLPNLAAATKKPTEDLEHTVPGSARLENKGGLCLGDDANSSAMTKQGRVTHMESAFNSITQQKTLMQQFQGQNTDLKSGLICGVFKRANPAKNDPHLLHVRLKQAASCIARLSREKQQLIEMGNRLRAQITSVGPQEPMELEKDTPTEKQGNHDGRLSMLEQLQYQLTTQELQYALKQKTCTIAEQILPGANSQGPSLKGRANTFQGLKSIHMPEGTKNKKKTVPLNLPQSQLHSGLSRTQLSSDESLWSLTMLWDTLDDGLMDSVFSEGECELKRRKEVAQSDGSGVQMMVHGSGLIPNQPQTEVQQRRSPSKTLSSTCKTNRPAVPARISKIRNYNVKD